MSSTDPFLVCAIIIFSFIVLASICILIVKLQSTEDQNTAWLPKLIVLISLYIACMNVMALPIDVYNVEHDAGIRIDLLWSILIIATGILLFALIPFSYIFFVRIA